jgi:hypothetical protein
MFTLCQVRRGSPHGDSRQSISAQGPSPDLAHGATPRRFVRPPPEESRPVTHVLAGDVIGAHLDD